MGFIACILMIIVIWLSVWAYSSHASQAKSSKKTTILTILAIISLVSGIYLFYLDDVNNKKDIEKYYASIEAKVNADYSIYVNGIRVEYENIDIRAYNRGKIKIDDENGKIIITALDKKSK